ESWRARAAAYPDKLMAALIDQALNADALTGWGAREALASRRDDLAIHDLPARTERAVVRALLALNRGYLPHPLIKWHRDLAGQLRVVPERLEERLQLLWASNSAQALEKAEGAARRDRASGRGTHGRRPQFIPCRSLRAPPRDRAAAFRLEARLSRSTS